MTIQICFLILVTHLTQRTIATYQDIYRNEENKYIVDDCGWLGLQMVSEPVITSKWVEKLEVISINGKCWL